MRLLVAATFALLALAPAAAQQRLEPCGDWGSFDWRAHFGFGPDDLVYIPEIRPEPISDALVSRIPLRGARPQPGSFAIAVVTVDSTGVARDVDVACAPSAAVANETASLVWRSEFVPARDRGRPIQHFVVLPLLPSEPHE